MSLHTGDCLALMAAMPDGCVDAVVCDPPYGTEGAAGGYGRRQLYGGGKYGRRIANDVDLTIVERALPEMVRLLVPDAWCALFGAPRRTGQLARLMEDAGLEPYGEVVWDKGAPGLGYTIRYQHETAIVARKGSPARPAEALISVIRVLRPRFAATGEEHPHWKPVPLLRRLVRFCCPEGGTVLDPFAGHAPVGVACALEARQYVGMEIDEGYATVGRERIARAGDQGTLDLEAVEVSA